MNIKKYGLIFGVWLFVYPFVTCILYLFRLLGWELPIALQTLIVTIILVPLMVMYIVPFVRQWTVDYKGKE